MALSCRVLCALLVVVVVVLGMRARGAEAADAAPSVRLEWSAPAGCIDRGELTRAVSGQLGRPAFSAAADTELVVRGRIQRDAAGRPRAEFLLSTRAGEPLGARTFEADTSDCRSLDEATAVMLAIMLNVRRADVPALARAAPPPTAPSPPDAPPPPWSWRAGAGAGLVAGLLPRAGVEIAATVAGGRGRWLQPALEIALDATGDAPAAEGTIRARAAWGRLALCPILAAGGRAELRLRVAAGAGAMWVGTSGFAQGSTETRAVVDGRAGLQLGVHLGGPLWGHLAAEAGGMALRPTFAVRNGDGTTEPLFRPAALSGTVIVGVTWRRP